METLLAQGKRPHKHELARREAMGDPMSFSETFPMILGQASGGIDRVQPAGEIVAEMAQLAAAVLQRQAGLVAKI